MKNEKGEALQAVTILIANSCRDSSIIAYGLTDEKGNYRLNFKYMLGCENILIKFNLLGYKKQEVSIDESLKKRALAIDIKLEPQNILLNDVIIKGKPIGFKQSNDTTRYNLSQFTDGTERKLEDVLKKLPGVNVADDGSISFKGKNIDKILIEGDNFFSKNYTVLSKNISAGLVNTVEALENFTDERLLKGITPSDKVVLNLKLKKDAGAVIFGDANNGIGTGGRYKSSANLFLFKKKLKFCFLENVNNTGEEAVSDIHYNLYGSNGKSYLTGNQGLDIRIPITEKLPESLEVTQNRYVPNKEVAGGMQINYNPSNKLKINFYSFLNLDRQRLSLQKNSNYLFPDSNFTIYEKSNYQYKPYILNTNLKLSYQTSSSSNIVYNIEVDKNHPNFLFDLLLNPTGTRNLNEPVVGNSDQKVYNSYNELIYTNRFSKEKAIVFQLAQSNYSNSFFLNQDTNRFSAINSIPSNWSLRQYGKINVRSYQASGKVLGLYRGHTYALSANVNNNVSYLNSFYIGNLGDNSSAAQSINLAYLRTTNYFLDMQDLVAWNEFKVTMSLRFSVLHQGVHNLTDSNILARTKFFILPKLQFEYKATIRNSLNLSYEQRNNSATITDVYNADIIYDHLSTFKGNGKLNDNLQHDIVLRDTYSNQDVQWIMNYTTSYHINNSPYLTQTTISNRLLINTFLPGIAKSYYLYNRFQSDKYLSFFRSNLRIIFSESQTTINSLINKDPIQKNRLSSLSGSASLNTVFDLPVNFQLGTSLQQSVLHLSNGSVTNNEINYRLSSTFKIFRYWNLKLSSILYNWKTLGDKTRSGFVDFRMGYKKPKQKFSAEFNIQNLLNQKSITFNNTDNYLVSQNSYQLIGRFAMLIVNYNF